MPLKRYKVIMPTSIGPKTAICEANSEDEAKKKAIADLPAWLKPKIEDVDVEEVGKPLRRTMP